MQINDILDELKEKYGINKSELELILDCQFKCAQAAIESRTKKSIKLIHLGKIEPTTFFIHNYEKLVK